MPPEKKTTKPFLGAILLLAALSKPGTGGAQGPQQSDLNLGFSAGVFVDVHTSDARAAAKVWSEGLMRNRGLQGPADAVIFENRASMVDAVTRNEVDMVVMLTKDYLDLEGQIPAEPRFVTLRRGRITESSLLIVHRLSGIKTVADLKGRDVILASDARASMARIWLDNILIERGYPALVPFSRQTIEATKYSRTVLPVFFRQVDAALVPRAGLETMAELNPQLNRELQVVAESPAYLSSVLCIRRDYRADFKQTLVEALRNLHTEAAGQQLLTLFRVDKLVPFQDSYLESAREALQKQKALAGKGKQRGAS